MRDKEMDMVIIFGSDERGFDEVKRAALARALAPYRPDYIGYPGHLFVRIAFRCRPGARGNADRLAARMRACLRWHPLLSGIRVGGGEGPCACRTDILGRVRSVGLGDVTYQAMRAAAG